MTPTQTRDLVRLAVAVQRLSPADQQLVAAALRESVSALLAWSGAVLPRLLDFGTPAPALDLARLTRGLVVALEPLPLTSWEAAARLLRLNDTHQLRRCLPALRQLHVELMEEAWPQQQQEYAQGYRLCRCARCGSETWKIPGDPCTCRSEGVADVA